MKSILEKVGAGTRLRQHLIEYGFATVLISVVVWIVVGRNMSSNNEEVKTEVQRTHTTVNQLQSKIDSVKAYQDMLLERTYQLEQSQLETKHLIETGNTLLIQNRRAIEKIRLENNEKISNAANYNFQQLDSFLTDRYGKGH